jgi:hypothetical protein
LIEPITRLGSKLQENNFEVFMSKSTGEARLSPREVAVRLRVGINFVYGLLYSGKLPATKEAAGWQIPEGSVTDYQANHARRKADDRGGSL